MDGIYRLTQDLPLSFKPSLAGTGTSSAALAGRPLPSPWRPGEAAPEAARPPRTGPAPSRQGSGRSLAEQGGGGGQGAVAAASRGGRRLSGAKGRAAPPPPHSAAAAAGGGGGGAARAARPSAARAGGGASSRAITLREGSMMPYNAQATLHAQRALWSLLLPCSVHGRVTDIWRAYFAQRLLWDVGLRLAFSPPWVVQFRNAHNYLADFNSEVPLYQQAGALVGALLRWQPAARTLPGRFEELYVHMYELGIVGLSDVRLAQAWLADLDRIGYPFPPILDRPPRAVKPARSGGVRERHGERRAATSGAGQAT